MIELTHEQVQALEHASVLPARVLNRTTQQTFVLLSVDEYERLTQDEYDDRPLIAHYRSSAEPAVGAAGCFS